MFSATREDPPLPLARLRAADLRFPSSEAAEFLNRVMGLSLSAQDTSTYSRPPFSID